MADKAHQSIRVNQTHGKRKEAEEAVIEYQHKTEDLAEDMVTEKKLFTAEKENLEAQVCIVESKIAQSAVWSLWECLSYVLHIISINTLNLILLQSIMPNSRHNKRTQVST